MWDFVIRVDQLLYDLINWSIMECKIWVSKVYHNIINNRLNKIDLNLISKVF